MIAVDTSSLVAFLNGERGEDVARVDEALESGQVVLPPVVVTEILSLPRLDRRVSGLIRELPVLEPGVGYWERAATTRASVLRRRLRARLADTLICQSCLDHRVALITRDADFVNFARHAGLSLAAEV
jgi:predicted nucleic acid-binding protein